MIGPTAGRTDYRDAQVVPVVSVSWLGRVWRLSTRSLAGSDIEIDPGLLEAPEVTDEVSLSPGGDVGSTISIAVVLPAEDVAALVGAGADLTDILAEVAWVWHRDGVLLHEWAAREIRAEGPMVEPEYGGPDQPAGYIAGSIEDSPYRVERPLVPWAWEITNVTFVNSPERGARYPQVFGQPDPTAVGGGPPAPVLTVDGVGDHSLLMVSAGWCQATQVTIIDSDGNTEVRDIFYTEDFLGVRVAAVSILSSTTLNRTPGTTYTSAWTAGPAQAPLGGFTPLHIAAHLLGVGGAAIDYPEWARVASLFRFPAGGYLDDPESRAWEVVRDLLTGLPITMRRDRDGWAPVLLDPHLARSTAVGRWDDGGPYRRVSVWSKAGEARVTKVEVSSDVTEATVGFGLARDAALPHAWVRHLPIVNEASTQVTWSWVGALDRRAASWLARSQALGWEVSAWQVPAEWGRARAGDWIYLSSDARYALVQRRTLVDGVWDYTLARPAGR